MLSAFLWGALAASALLIGALVAIGWSMPTRVLGLITAFGSGVLISAVAYDLVEEASQTDGSTMRVGLGLFVGSVVYYVGDVLVDRMGGTRAPADPTASDAGGAGLPIVLGAVLDGIPESLVLGLGLLSGEGVSVAFLAAVFISNFPEGLAGTSGLLKSGWTRRKVLGLWIVVVVVSALASLTGYGVFDTASPSAVAFVLSFAGGAVLTMLADSMMPDAFADGGKPAGLFTAMGFSLAFFLHTIQ